MLAQMRHALNRRGPGPNDTHAPVLELIHAAGRIAAGVVIVPPTRMEGMPLELFDPGDRRELGSVQRPTRHDHKARLEDIIAISSNRPALFLLVPARLFN